MFSFYLEMSEAIHGRKDRVSLREISISEIQTISGDSRSDTTGCMLVNCNLCKTRTSLGVRDLGSVAILNLPKLEIERGRIVDAESATSTRR